MTGNAKQGKTREGPDWGWGGWGDVRKEGVGRMKKGKRYVEAESHEMRVMGR